MIRKSANRFSEKIMLQQELERDNNPPERIALYSIRPIATRPLSNKLERWRRLAIAECLPVL
jgi:hypothetical protein